MATPTDVRPVTRRALDFLHGHARLVERRLAQAWFAAPDPAHAHAVLHAVEAHRNADGGLGHGLEPDVLAPDSQPLAADFALEAVEQAVRSPSGRHESVREHAHALAVGLADHLATVASGDGGLPIVLPTITGYPHAEHWGDGVFPAGLNPTASIVARLRALGVTSTWTAAAERFCHRHIEALRTAASADAHTVLTAFCFLDHVAEQGDVREQEHAREVTAEIAARATTWTSFHLYPGSGYGLGPLDFAPTPDHPRLVLFPEDAVAAQLTAIRQSQLPDGGWALSWQPPGPAAELAWRGVLALRNARLLHDFGG
ncbi:hypothetical protein FHR81_004496 [Actinoalloteichus hoggarensis]|uniref:Uncharacterized protein n=1 Tax=Actinoalloteichus hoggarensis TaxID=1470176 RepID=A0A221W417_9PSEU|nr:hypothetical protein [Actinoalloteichus hoggarensis]ASO20387.1 hypothetical protein AHOG_13720 [Actinoalloteichus hoggarensis]MBB5923425.1 hypothetical protein [Actinoalloteichus hoggarensis]